MGEVKRDLETEKKVKAGWKEFFNEEPTTETNKLILNEYIEKAKYQIEASKRFNNKETEQHWEKRLTFLMEIKGILEQQDKISDCCQSEIERVYEWPKSTNFPQLEYEKKKFKYKCLKCGNPCIAEQQAQPDEEVEKIINLCLEYADMIRQRCYKGYQNEIEALREVLKAEILTLLQRQPEKVKITRGEIKELVYTIFFDMPMKPSRIGASIDLIGSLLQSKALM